MSFISNKLSISQKSALLALVPALVSCIAFAVLLYLTQQTAVQTLRVDPYSALAAGKQLKHFELIIVAGLLSTLAFGLITSWFVIGDISRRINHALFNARALRAHEPQDSILAGVDEIAEVDRILHDIGQSIASMSSVLNESKTRVRALLESMPVALIISSRDGLVDMSNTATEEIFGFSRSELTGKHISVLFTGMSDKLHGEVMESIYTNFIGRVRDLDAVKKDGSRIPVELSVTSLQTEAEQRLLIAAFDVSERRNVEKMKREFVQMISHDLRSPLTAVLANLEAIGSGRHGNLDESGKQTILICESDLNRLIGMIDALLDLEKLQDGKMHLDLNVVDMAAIMSQSKGIVSPLAADKGITLEVPEASLEALADAEKLVQVMVNLLSNAIKFSDSGTKITVNYQERDNFIEVKVTDEGRGVPLAEQERIFDRFAQVLKSDQSEKKGKGLGLAICKAIVTAHGGKIGVISENREGSTFFFTLPQPAE